MSNFLCPLPKSPTSYLTIPAESRPKMSNKMSNFLKRDTIFSFLDIFFLGRSLSILWFLNYWTSDGWLWILIYAMYEIELSHSLLRMIDINLSVKFLDMLPSVHLSIHPSVRSSSQVSLIIKAISFGIHVCIRNVWRTDRDTERERERERQTD